MATADATSEPLTLGQLNDDRAEDVCHLRIAELRRDGGQRLGGLVTNDSLVLTSKVLKKRQESGLVGEQIEDLAEFLSDGKKNFVILGCNEICSENSKDG